MDAIKEWWVEERARKAVEKLMAHDFKAIYVKTKVEAVQEILKQITPGVGPGGVNPVMDALGFEGVKETLHRSIVEAIALAAH